MAQEMAQCCCGRRAAKSFKNPFKLSRLNSLKLELASDTERHSFRLRQETLCYLESSPLRRAQPSCRCTGLFPVDALRDFSAVLGEFCLCPGNFAFPSTIIVQVHHHGWPHDSDGRDERRSMGDASLGVSGNPEESDAVAAEEARAPWQESKTF